MISADTSVLVRYLVGSPPEQAAAAARLIDGARDIGVSPVTLAECAHVLRTQYGIERGAVLDRLVELVQRENVAILGARKSLVVECLVHARSMPARPVPDALIVAAARDAGAIPLATFDRDQRRYGIEIDVPG